MRPLNKNPRYAHYNFILLTRQQCAPEKLMILLKFSPKCSSVYNTVVYVMAATQKKKRFTIQILNLQNTFFTVARTLTFLPNQRRKCNEEHCKSDDQLEAKTSHHLRSNHWLSLNFIKRRQRYEDQLTW